MDSTSVSSETILTANSHKHLLFPRGLPGFKNHRRFLLSSPLDIAPLTYLESLTPPFPQFLLLPTQSVDPHYDFQMEPLDRNVLYPPDSGLVVDRPDREITLYFIVSAVRDSPPTVNMLAPIAIRPALLRGVQAVRSDSVYSHVAPLALVLGEAR